MMELYRRRAERVCIVKRTMSERHGMYEKTTRYDGTISAPSEVSVHREAYHV